MAKKKEEKKIYNVIQTFRDKHTLEVYEANDDYEADDKRAKELKGYINEKPSE